MTIDELRRALDAERDAEWTSWPHAYGPARDTPGHLLALLGDEKAAQSKAARHFCSAIVHQSTLWPASPDAFGWLLRVLRVRVPGTLPSDVVVECLGALIDATEFLDQAPGTVPELPPAARGWLTRFAAAGEDDLDELWEDGLDGEVGDALYEWVFARMVALQPEVAALTSVSVEDAEVAEAMRHVRKAWDLSPR
jgi:hypothetical protein